VEGDGRDGAPPRLADWRSPSRRQFLGTAAAGGFLAASGGLLAGCGSSGQAKTSTSTGGGASPKHGGNLRMAIVGGSSTDTLDVQETSSQVDNMRLMALYNGLVQFRPDGSIANVLAEEISSTQDGLTWTVRLRKGVTFHNGKPLTAEDVLYTFRRNMDPKDPKVGATQLRPVDPNGLKALDTHTVEFKMLTPFSTFAQQIADLYYFGIVPVGYDPQNPVGTGPFKYGSFTPGQESVFVRNPSYFRAGLPYLDKLTIIDSFSDYGAAQNALLGGTVNAFTQAPLVSAKLLAGNSSVKQLISEPDQWVPFTMRVDQAPFRDVRVRQAFRYIVNRPQIVAQAFDGLAVVGNDVFCPQDPDSDHSLQRHQDIPLAKHLLKSAGYENLTIQLQTSDGIAAGAVESAQVFAQQARAAGVRVQISNLPATDFFGPNYLKWVFAQDFWGNPPYVGTIAQCELPGSPFNETHFDNPQFNKLYAEVNATTDAALQKELVHEMQLIDFNEGGYIIPAFNRQLDLLAPSVHGLTPSTTGIPMGNADWEHVWIE
jgi:peptide/nickel transport system substrate-binding protein